jgi:NAD dependent epimerase/dehydratase family enzyme
VMKIPLLPFPVPEVALKLILGEMSDIILKGSRVSCEKLLNTGYRFLYSNLEDALFNVIKGQ